MSDLNSAAADSNPVLPRRAESRFLANISHELRTPMNAILGMVDVAIPKATDPVVQDCLQTIKKSANLLLTLLSDLLDSAKIDSGKLELEAAPFSLRRMLEHVAGVVSEWANERGLRFSSRIPRETPDAVVGDRMRLQQVLLHLARNAVKFSERGEIEIGLRVMEEEREKGRKAEGEIEGGKSPTDLSLSLIPPLSSAPLLEFSVRDTGIGIASSALECLFHPFTQADASLPRRFGGAGLGLFICKSLVEMMDGTMQVESEPGRGSTFRFSVRLPLAAKLPPDSGAPNSLPAVASRRLRVLLVDDNPANRKLAAYILKGRGHLVDFAGNGCEALCLTERNNYDVILMDLEMPVMNGLDATAAIRGRECGGGRVPIVAVTAYALEEDRDRCLAAGMDGYLAKPVNGQEMIGLVEGLAEKRFGKASDDFDQ